MSSSSAAFIHTGVRVNRMPSPQLSALSSQNHHDKPQTNLVLYPPPHIPSGSEQNGRNLSGSDQIPTSFRVKNKNKFKLRFLAIPSFSESFRVESELKKIFIFRSFSTIFRPYSDLIPTIFRQEGSFFFFQTHLKWVFDMPF